MAVAAPRKAAIYSRGQVEDLIANGRTIIIVDDKVLKCDPWLKFHPGGDKAIMHMVGRDATDEVNALHSPEARQRMNSYQIGIIQGPWINFIPPIQGGKFRTLAEQSKENNAEDDKASSGSESDAPSPVFDAVPGKSSARRRAGFTQSSASSSATSLESMTIDPKEQHKLGAYSGNEVTRRQIDYDLAHYPSLEAPVQAEIVKKYRALNERIRAEGLYDCNYTAYAIEGVRYASLFGLSMLTLHWGWYAVSAVFLGMFWHQLTFTAHDAGHMGITHNFNVDTVIGIIVADFLGGLSLGWWKRNHNVHHIVTNSPEHDPDIEHMPFFAISHRFFESLRSTYYDRIMAYDAVARFTVKYQHHLYYPILMLGRFNLYRLSWEYLLLGQGPRKGPAAWHRWLEIAGQIFFWTWYAYGLVYRCIPSGWDRLAFVLISHAVTTPVHVQITLSHFAMSTADLGEHESFPQKMLRTTMDVDCPAWLDFFHGGLQFQAIHHLYPRIPRHNLRRTQKLVQDFCADVGIPYALYGFVDGNKQVISRLGDVAQQARILAECQRSIATKPLDAH